jgi:hypothetical protein
MKPLNVLRWGEGNRVLAEVVGKLSQEFSSVRGNQPLTQFMAKYRSADPVRFASGGSSSLVALSSEARAVVENMARYTEGGPLRWDIQHLGARVRPFRSARLFYYRDE